VSDKLFDEVVNITEEYLGPAAQRFVARQVSYHLGKNPEELDPEDIPRLVEWAQATLAMLTSDKAMVREYGLKVSELAERS
jgi:hypothetical protein